MLTYPKKLSCKINGKAMLLFRLDLDNPATVTPAEKEILVLLNRGLSNKRIASERRCSVNTVSNQLSGLYKKFGVYDRVSLLRAVKLVTEA
jgi:DNA-binding NarL/FixJ family response regulator